jgi:FtsZ-binding cell division protein ZapB
MQEEEHAATVDLLQAELGTLQMEAQRLQDQLMTAQHTSNALGADQAAADAR